MPTNRLTTLTIRSAARRAQGAGEPVTVSDGSGLSLIVRPDGSGLWRFRYRWQDKQQMLSAGRWPEVQLAEARETRETLRAELRAGRMGGVNYPVRSASIILAGEGGDRCV
jgi:hypothetical protein